MTCNAFSVSFTASPVGFGGRSLDRRPPVAPVRQIDEDCGLLACVESIARDRNLRLDQAALSGRYPHLRRRPASDRGRMGVRAALEIMADLGLSSNSETVHGRALAMLATRIPGGVLLVVEDGLGRTRWWRIAEILSQGVRVMQPEAPDPGRYGLLTWDEIESMRGCAVAFDP